MVQSLPLFHGPHAVLTHVEERNNSLKSEPEVLIAVSKNVLFSRTSYQVIRYFTDVSEKSTLSVLGWKSKSSNQ